MSSWTRLPTLAPIRPWSQPAMTELVPTWNVYGPLGLSQLVSNSLPVL